ncbi:hypothetical protein J6590_024859 [Homalodisca vitripennis]|nr:hypothetical protein J6590_024859 [Homalodisca vitripennis]
MVRHALPEAKLKTKARALYGVCAVWRGECLDTASIVSNNVTRSFVLMRRTASLPFGDMTLRKDADVHVGGFSLDNDPDVVIASPELLYLDHDSDIIPATLEPCSLYDSERYCGAPLLFVRPLTVNEFVPAGACAPKQYDPQWVKA